MDESASPVLVELGGAALGVAAGLLLVVTSIRDYLLYLESYDLGLVGTTDSLAAAIGLLLSGAVLLVISLHLTISTALTRRS